MADLRFIGGGTPDPGEPGIADVTVELYDDLANLIDTQTTDPTGHYTFAGLAAGDYTIDMDETTLPAGTDTPTTTEPLPITLTYGQNNTTADFGYWNPASIGDLVWNDTDGDGTPDPGEPGIGDVTVELYDLLAADIAGN